MPVLKADTGEQVSQPPVDLDQLLRDLDRFIKREEVERAAGLLPPDVLMELARKEAAAFERRQRRGTQWTLGALFGVCVAGGMLALAGSPEFLALFGPICIGLAVGLVLYLPIRARRSVCKLLSDMHDPKFLGAALNLLANDPVAGSNLEFFMGQFGSSAQHPILSALIRMLRSVRADHAEMLTKEQMEILLSLLRNSWIHSDLKCAILKSLEQIGDEAALPIVESLVNDRGPIVRNAAQDCLPYLQRRAIQQQQARMLLRASDGGINSAVDALLRPAAAGADTAPEQLLRPQI